MSKNGQIYFKNLAVWSFFNIMYGRIKGLHNIFDATQDGGQNLGPKNKFIKPVEPCRDKRLSVFSLTIFYRISRKLFN